MLSAIVKCPRFANHEYAAKASEFVYCSCPEAVLLFCSASLLMVQKERDQCMDRVETVTETYVAQFKRYAKNSCWAEFADDSQLGRFQFR